MKILKKSFVIVMVFCLIFSLAGCVKKTYDNFDPLFVYVVDGINGETYEYEIIDEETTKEMWEIFQGVEVEDNGETAEIGEAYLLMKFYDKDNNTILFTVYNNGTCCFNRDYDVLYTTTNGRAAYADLCEIYETYAASNESAFIGYSGSSSSDETTSDTSEQTTSDTPEEIIPEE